jgi:hypothetical protein
MSAWNDCPLCGEPLSYEKRGDGLAVRDSIFCVKEHYAVSQYLINQTINENATIGKYTLARSTQSDTDDWLLIAIDGIIVRENVMIKLPSFALGPQWTAERLHKLLLLA